ncbi:hypothetical protein [Endozoicomonas ascidiicola]|uniref:hypothetical protein n=1 Tax=Endozoicomonas ascidiicola TaxID=1698521 RepID=UPI00082956AD|nr:hypothetical protein [Endozoicomonas ascidiicola]
MNRNSMSQTELAKRWSISQRTLERWRSLGWGPTYHKMGGRVIYMTRDVEAYEAQTAMRSTSEHCRVIAAGGQS